jgi:hypothetical protein
MSWPEAKKRLETVFTAIGWRVVHNQKMDVLVITTLQGEIYFFGKDNNPDNLTGFSFNSLLESTPRYTLDSVEVFIAWFIKNN